MKITIYNASMGSMISQASMGSSNTFYNDSFHQSPPFWSCVSLRLTILENKFKFHDAYSYQLNASSSVLFNAWLYLFAVLVLLPSG